jgi:hypothetical protein
MVTIVFMIIKLSFANSYFLEALLVSLFITVNLNTVQGKSEM